MKLLICLFSIYILILSGIPCSADDECCPDEISHVAKTERGSSSDNKPISPCSPFFACGACHGVTIPIYNTIEFTQDLRFIVKPQTLYKEKPLSDFVSFVWQPPQKA